MTTAIFGGPASRHSGVGQAVLVISLLTVAAAGRELGDKTLPTGWHIRPAGRQISLDTFPFRAALLPDGERMVVLHSGYRPPSLAIVRLSTGRIETSLVLPDAGQGFRDRY